MSISKACSLEIFDLLHLAQEAESKGKKELSAIYRSKVDVLRVSGVSSAELRGTYADALGESLGIKPPTEFEQRYNDAFKRFLAGRDEAEIRAIADSGTAPNSQTFSAGVQGGYFVSQQFDRVLRDAKIQTDPVVHPDVVSVIQEPGYVMGGKNVSGFDLTTVTASSTADGTQQAETNLASVALAHQAQISNYPTYKVNLAVSLEAEEDIDQFQTRVAIAAGVAMARKQGQDVITTLAAGISSTYETATSGVVTITDLQNIIFQVDRLYRKGGDGVGNGNGKTGWLMGDDVWGLLNRMGSAEVNGETKAAVGVPYLSALCSPASEVLCGYPVHICPSLATSVGASPISNGTIYFGDLSKIVVRKSQVWAKRTLQSGINPGSVSYGQALLVFRQRAGAVYFDPGSATKPAVVAATVRV